MMLKRWAFQLFCLLLGTGVGLASVHYARQKMEVPPLAGLVVVLFFTAVFYMIAYASGQRLFPGPSPADFFAPQGRQRPWAWLKPQGKGPASGFPLYKDQMFIGREVRCDVMLNNESVSRRHAEVLRLAEGFLLRDLNSRNGTYVNGQRIQEYLLQDGDTVTVGDINMIFEAARRPVPAEPEPVSSLASGLEVEETGTAVTRPSEEGDTEVWRRKRPG